METIFLSSFILITTVYVFYSCKSVLLDIKSPYTPFPYGIITTEKSYDNTLHSLIIHSLRCFKIFFSFLVNSSAV